MINTHLSQKHEAFSIYLVNSKLLCHVTQPSMLKKILYNLLYRPTLRHKQEKKKKS